MLIHVFGCNVTHPFIDYQAIFDQLRHEFPMNKIKIGLTLVAFLQISIASAAEYLIHAGSLLDVKDLEVLKNQSIRVKDNKIIAISCDGNYYLAEIDPKGGGECKKSMQRNLLSDES